MVKKLDIKGVPTILIVKNNRIVWKGRFCAFDYSDFENFMNHTLSSCFWATCPVNECEICEGDVSISKEVKGF